MLSAACFCEFARGIEFRVLQTAGSDLTQGVTWMLEERCYQVAVRPVACLAAEAVTGPRSLDALDENVERGQYIKPKERGY